MDDVVTTVAILAALCAIYRRQCRRVRQISEMRRKGLFGLNDLPRTIAVG